MLTLTDRSRARASRDDYHARGFAELSRPSPGTGEAAYLFWLAAQCAPRTPQQRLEVVALAFASLPRAAGYGQNLGEVEWR